MKLCRYDAAQANDRLGVVQGDQVIDVSDLRDAVIASAPWTGQGDVVIARLPQLMARIASELQRDLVKCFPGR